MRAAFGSFAVATLLLACSHGVTFGSSGSSADTKGDCNFAAPSTTASCQASSQQNNGCHGGYFCNNDTGECTSPEDVSKTCPGDAGGADAAPGAAQPSPDAGSGEAGNEDAEAPPAGPAIASTFYTPSDPSTAGLQPVINAIASATQTIEMEMFHLTVTEVAQALNAAAGQGVTVQIIIDQDNWNNHTAAALKTELNVPGITVTPSSPKFRITHEKSFVIDNGTPQATAYIMSLNLTSP